jgi:CRP-like cAMP-binding protein
MPSANSPHQNRLLAAFSPEDSERFFSDLHPVSLALRHVIQAVADPFEYVYFVEQGVASVLTVMANGAAIEVGMIGTEGLIGVSALLGAEVSSQNVICQIPGTALRMNTARCLDAFNQSAEVRKVLLRFADMLFNLSAQTAACNRLHSIEQRCARWLLMARARHTSDVIPMTHEFLSSMLGVRRAGVTETAGELQRSGLIRLQQGKVTIIDRDGLEGAACECYALDRDRLNHLL